MSAGMLIALGKLRNDPREVSTSAGAQLGRDGAGHQRVFAIEIGIGAVAAERQQRNQVLPQFKELCTMGQSVRAGIPVELAVYDGSGAFLNGLSKGQG